MPENSKPECALRTSNASLTMTTNRDAIKTGSFTNIATSAAGLNMWKTTLAEAAHNKKHAENSKVQISNVSVRTEFPTITIDKHGRVQFPYSFESKISR